MEGYKNYIMPAVALLLLLVWFFVIQPRMTGDDAASSDAPAAVGADAKAKPKPATP